MIVNIGGSDLGIGFSIIASEQGEHAEDFEVPVRVKIGDDSFEIDVLVPEDNNVVKLTFEFIAFRSRKLVLRRRVDGRYDPKNFPDTVLWSAKEEEES